MGGGLAMGGQSESSDGDTDTGSIQISNTCCHLPGCVDRMVGGVEVEAYAVIQSAPAAAAAGWPGQTAASSLPAACVVLSSPAPPSTV